MLSLWQRISEILVKDVYVCASLWPVFKSLLAGNRVDIFLLICKGIAI